MNNIIFEQAREALPGMLPHSHVIESGKFGTVPLHKPGSPEWGFLKFTLNSEANSWEDLENEALWSQQHRKTLGEQGILVPEVLQHDPEFNWVLFEFFGRSGHGRFVTAGETGQALDIASAIFRIPLDRPSLTNLEDWYKSRVNRFSEGAAILFKGLAYLEDSPGITLEKIQKLGEGAIDISCLKPGIIHGDLKDSNMLITADGNALVDGEFGTLQVPPTGASIRERRRTEHDKPRFHDIAYYYHLLRQTVGALEARGFLSDIKRTLNLDSETERELKLSIVERTLSMAHHFVIERRAAAEDIQDPRRTRAKRYGSLLIDVMRDLE